MIAIKNVKVREGLFLQRFRERVQAVHKELERVTAMECEDEETLREMARAGVSAKCLRCAGAYLEAQKVRKRSLVEMLAMLESVEREN